MSCGFLKGKKIKCAVGCVLTAIFLIIAAGVGIYCFDWRSKPIYYASRVIPYPAILVNWEPVLFGEYFDDSRALEKYWNYQKNNSYSRPSIQNIHISQMRENLVNKLIQEKIVSIFAKKKGISVTEEEKHLEWEQTRSNFENPQEISDFIAMAYGWTEQEYIDRVLEPFLLQEKVKKYLSGQSRKNDEQLLQTAQEIRSFAVKENADFSELAEKYSEDDSTANRGGDLGYFSRGTMDPYFEEAVFSMEIGEISQPVKSSYGYHIIKLEDLLYSEQDVPINARARHILIKDFDFDEWIKNQKDNMDIYRLVE